MNRMYLAGTLASVLILLNALSVRAAGDPHFTLTGFWFEENLPGSELIEFPNIIQFKPNGHYSILNEAYGFNPQKPEVETGQYKFDCDTIYLCNRKYVTNYAAYGNDSTGKLIVLGKSNDSLSVKYNSYYFILRRSNGQAK